jgi:hypothetical protein
MCKTPVTFGGGKTIENASLFEAASAVKYPAFIHFSYSADSISEGEKVEANSRLEDIVRSLDYALFSS